MASPQNNNLKPAAAIFILVIMVMSVAGFALNSASFSQEAPQQEIPSVIREPLDTSQQVYILRTGRVLIEHYYTADCTDCLDKNVQLEEFAAQLPGYVVINEVLGNESRLDMIGAQGRITSLESQSLAYDDLIDTFCDNAIAQPRVCIIREF
jgi:cytosine/uracil/thiamine/allantoin permease